MEYWKDIRGYEEYYQVSSEGRVRSKDRWTRQKLGSVQLRKGRLLRLAPHRGGYLQVKLYINGGRKSFLVHQLVAQAFLANPEKLPCVNHKNEDKTDNRVENLEFCSTLYNNTYGTRIERLRETWKKKRAA